MRAVLTGCLALALSAPGLATDDRQTPGDPDRGRAVFLDRELGHCLLCHQVAQLDAPFQGNIGPDLSNVGARLDAAAIRARIADPTRQNPETVMPAYARTDDLVQVDPRFAGQPILDARQLDDLVAYVASLRQPSGRHGDG